MFTTMSILWSTPEEYSTQNDVEYNVKYYEDKVSECLSNARNCRNKFEELRKELRSNKNCFMTKHLIDSVKFWRDSNRYWVRRIHYYEQELDFCKKALAIKNANK